MSRRIIGKSARFVWSQRLRSDEFAFQTPDDLFASRGKNLLYGETVPSSLHESVLHLLPPPTGLPDLDKAATRLLDAVQRGEGILICGDYDVDGITSSALLLDFFGTVGVFPHLYIPERLTEGYGLSKRCIDTAVERNCSVVITVDNGTAAFEACDYAMRRGVDVIVTDHHDVMSTLPNAFALVNPKHPDSLFAFKKLAGVGVAFYVAAALRAKMKSAGFLKGNELNLRRSLDFVALGTIADLVPLDGANHILCKTGLRVLSEHLREGIRPGLFELLVAARWKFEDDVDAACVGFQIAPRLNAAGRLGNAERAVELLITKNEERARLLAAELDQENSLRQEIERRTVQEACAMVETNQLADAPAIVLAHADWHPGVVGLVASRIVEKYYRPALVFGGQDGHFRGSGRSTHAFDLFGALEPQRQKFLAFGGHFHAVGMTILASEFLWLREYLCQLVSSSLSAADTIKPLEIDGVSTLESLQLPFLQRLQILEPFGISNPRPRWLLREVNCREIRRIGRNRADNHAKLLLEDETSSVWATGFGLADLVESCVGSGESLAVVVEARLQRWKGEISPDIRVLDLLPSSHLLESRSKTTLQAAANLSQGTVL